MTTTATTIHEPVYPTLRDLTSLVKACKRMLARYNRKEIPEMDLTVGWDSETGDWSYQTGDNSFTGGAYGYPIWAVVTVYRRANSRELAKEIQDQLSEEFWVDRQ